MTHQVLATCRRATAAARFRHLGYYLSSQAGPMPIPTRLRFGNHYSNKVPEYYAIVLRRYATGTAGSAEGYQPS
jgi:hypothetical protein